jgi:peptidase E
MSSSHGLDDNFQYYWDIEEQLRRYNYIKKKIKVFKKLGCTLEEITILMGELEILKKLGLR